MLDGDLLHLASLGSVRIQRTQELNSLVGDLNPGLVEGAGDQMGKGAVPLGFNIPQLLEITTRCSQRLPPAPSPPPPKITKETSLPCNLNIEPKSIRICDKKTSKN